MSATIEIEYRSLITEEDFLRLKKFLGEHAQNLGDDNKDTYFYVWPDKVIKVVDNKTTGKAKIVLKPGRIHTQSHFHESELTLIPAEISTAKQFCENLEPEKIMQAYQFRTNYEYKGVEIAVKYTQSFGFHVELEILVDDENKKEEAGERIRLVAEELGIRLLSAEDLQRVVVELEGGMNYGAYTNENFPYK